MVGDKPTVVSGRYELSGILGRGGMATVYRCRDQTTGEELALKRLEGKRLLRKTAERLFAREFQILASLNHPRIIEVYDFGVDRGTYYYTMELLDGSDMGKLAPLPYRQVCMHLRDVLSSLALIHAQRMLHRDVTPRNVRLTNNGRAKLLDFGAMTPFGACGEVVGTPAAIAPEVIARGELDPRTDLYSVGALAYWLLTGHRAYPAQTFKQLRQLWHRYRPPPPSTHKIESPPALDALVMTMLSLRPRGRPTSAAEVLDQLAAIADLPAEEEPLVARSYLTSGQLVQRERQQRQIRQRLRASRDKRGCVLIIRGPEGSGKTRLLAEVFLMAQLQGILALQVDAKRCSGPFAVAESLALEALRAYGQPAVASLRFPLALLELEMPRLARRVAEGYGEKLPTDKGASSRADLPQGLRDWLVRLSAASPMALLVDNLHCADPPSAALLASLAQCAKRNRVLLVATLLEGASGEAAAAVEVLRKHSRCLRVGPFDAKGTLQFVLSLFGEVPNAERLARWLSEESMGNPMICMKLARFLVETDVIRYSEGAWVLPDDFDEVGVPRDAKLIERWLTEILTPRARGLAEGLSLHAGPLSENDCVGLAQADSGASAAAAQADLDELVREGVLVGADGQYAIGHERVRQILSAGLGVERAQRLHLALARTIEEAAAQDPFASVRAGLHLMRGGEEARGAELIYEYAIPLAERGALLENAMPALEAALVYFDGHRGAAESRASELRRCKLATMLLSVRALNDPARLSPQLRQQADATMATLKRLTGMDWAGRLQPTVGSHLSLALGLGKAVLAARGSGLVGTALRYFGAGTALRAVLACTTHDLPALNVVLEDLAPLRGLPTRSVGKVIYELCEGMRAALRGQPGELRRKLSPLLEVLKDPRGLKGVEEGPRAQILSACLQVLALNERNLLDDTAMHRAIEGEKERVSFFRPLIEYVKFSFYLTRGRLALAERHRRRVELFALDGGSTKWFDLLLFNEVTNIGWEASADAVSLKRLIDRLRRLEKSIPATRPILALAWARYECVRGNSARAVQICREWVEACPPRQHPLWLPFRRQFARSLNAMQHYEQAKGVCLEALSHVHADDRPYVLFWRPLEIELAIAEAGLGDFDAATRRCEAMLQEAQAYDNQLWSGIVHALSASVALTAGQRQPFIEHMAAAETDFAAIGNKRLLVDMAILYERAVAKELVPAKRLRNRRDSDWLREDALAEETEVEEMEDRAEGTMLVPIAHVQPRRDRQP